MKALILEDNPALSQSLQDILLQKGWQSHSSYSWNEASQWIGKNSFELLVLDILLPDKKGFEVLKILSQKKMSSLLKIVLISGFVDESFVLKNIPETLKANCVFFKKPIDEKAFLNFLQKIQRPKPDKKEMSLFESFFERVLPSKPLSFYLPQNKTFDSKELISSVFIAHLTKFTGDLKVTMDKKNESLIQFYNGYITKVISSSKKSFFGALLVEHGLSLQEDIETLLANKESNKLVGERLVEKELLSPYMLNFILKEQVKIRLSEIMSHPSFKLDIIEKPFENSEAPDIDFIDFNEIDFTEWLADSLQTELTTDFLQSFYLEIKPCLIQKSEPINKILIHQKQFLQDYKLLFKNLREGCGIKDMVTHSKNTEHTLRLLYFGLLTKSVYLKNETTKESKNLQKIELLLDSIIEKDSEDPFALLNLPWNASSEEAEKSYKQLIQKIHPDLFPTTTDKHLKKKSEKAFYKITKSYEILKSEEKRKEYIKGQKEENFVTVMNKYEEGLTKIKQEKYKMSLEILSPIANYKHAPSNVPLYILWAQIKSSSDLDENREKAVNIKKAIDSCPISLRTSSLFWYVKGLFCAQTKQYEKAKQLFQKSLTVQKDFLEAKKELILIKKKIKDSQTKNKKNVFNFFLKKSS